MGTCIPSRAGIFTSISPQNQYFAPVYLSTQCCSHLLSLSLLISMATVKSLTSDLHTAMFSMMVLLVFLFLKSKCFHMLALPLSFLTTINSSCSRTTIFVRERDREREFCPLSGFQYTGTLRPVPVYRTEATCIGALGITAAYRQP